MDTQTSLGHLVLQPSLGRRLCWLIIASAPRTIRAIWHFVAYIDGTRELLVEWWHGWERPKTPNGLLRANCAQYNGPTRVLPDGSFLEKGNVVLEIHLESTHIAAEEHSMRRSMKALADYKAIVSWLNTGAREKYRIVALHSQTVDDDALGMIGFEMTPCRDSRMLPIYRVGLQLYFEGYAILYRRGGITHLLESYKEVADFWLPTAWAKTVKLHRHNGSSQTPL